jgi:ATP-binding cassette, subfamily B, bacterial MsbA
LKLRNRLAKYFARYRWTLLIGGICTALAASIPGAVILLCKQFVEALGTSNQGALTTVCGEVVGLYLINWVVTYGQTYFLSSATNRIAVDIRNDVYAHIQSMPLSFFDRTRTGHIISRITYDVGLIQSGANVIIPIISAPVTILAGVVIMFKLSWSLSIISVIVVPLMALAIAKIGRKLRSLSSLLQISLADLTAALEDAMVGVRIIKSFGTEDYEINRFAEQNDRSYRAAMRGVRRSAAVSPTVQVLGALASVGVLYYGASQVQRHNVNPGLGMTAAGLIAYLAAVNYVAASARHLGQVNVTYQQTMAGADRIFELLDEKSDLVESAGAVELPPTTGKVEFRDVTFQYKEDVDVLMNVSFTMEPGKVLAIVGPSGSGKSTIANLIPRFYDVTEGSVSIDGNDVRDLTLDSLRGQIGIVPQQTILFTGTIRENVSYGRFDATDEEIEEAARAAHAHDFITQLKDGYDTVVGERGVALSGGERQRISIARALLRNPRILILDEATSSLDSASEALVQQALERLMQGRTTLVIAHRLSTITKADRIIVLQDGRIIENGTFTQLLANDGLFRALYNTQFRREEESVVVD